MTLRTSLQRLRQKINQTLHSQKTSHISPSQASYGVYVVNIWRKLTTWCWHRTIIWMHFVWKTYRQWTLLDSATWKSCCEPNSPRVRSPATQCRVQLQSETCSYNVWARLALNGGNQTQLHVTGEHKTYCMGLISPDHAGGGGGGACQYSDITWWSSWRLKSPADHMFFNSLSMFTKKTSVLLMLCDGNPPWIGWLGASNAESVSVSWRHHVAIFKMK